MFDRAVFAADHLCSCNHAVSAHDEMGELDFATVGDELDEVLVSVSNLLERSWPPRAGSSDAQAVVLGLYRVAWVSFKTLRYFCAEVPPDSRRWPEFVTSAGPVERSIVDAFANIIYLFQDNLDERAREFGRRGWVEDRRRANELAERYASNPAWRPYLDTLQAELARIQRELGISNADVATLRRWPRLSDMISQNAKHRDRIADQRRREFLEYIEDLMYREFSQDTHLSGPGLYRRADLLLTESRFWNEQQRELCGRRRTDAIMGSIALMLAIASELEFSLRLEMAPRILAVWLKFCRVSSFHTDLLMRRHFAFFRGAGFISDRPNSPSAV
jgi:hypothetical protein